VTKVFDYFFDTTLFSALPLIFFLLIVSRVGTLRQYRTSGLIFVFTSALFAFFIMHRYSTQISMGSPSLQTLFFLFTILPPLLYFLPGSGLSDYRLDIAKMIAGFLLFGIYIKNYYFPYGAALFYLLTVSILILDRDKKFRFSVTILALLSVQVLVYSSAAGHFLPSVAGLSLRSGIWHLGMWGFSFLVFAFLLPSISTSRALSFLPSLLFFLFFAFRQFFSLPAG